MPNFIVLRNFEKVFHPLICLGGGGGMRDANFSNFIKNGI